MNFSEIVGRTFKSIDLDNSNDTITFNTIEGDRFRMYHSQGCCESVSIEEVHGDISDLIGYPILLAEEVTYDGENPQDVKVPEYQDSFKWTFYELATIKGSVTIRWYGSSNGYYSESVDFERIGDREFY